LDIPMLIECYNNMKFASSLNMSVRLDGLEENKKPSACIGCGQCAHACPQGIDVPSVLHELDEMYRNGPKWADASRSRHESIKKDLNMQ
ncbi:MAG: 4Fe-4S dicluster domain-containing protein, partial [Erysipelotrichaceae bacterium]|nr:4Fe-4S dicluster domain-containing protein [Erysipelotrichaceae bacterium]